jgi:hypothetical protein
MLSNNSIAIQDISSVAKETHWDSTSQVIIACEFITSLDKDQEFKRFLEEKKISQK